LKSLKRLLAVLCGNITRVLNEKRAEMRASELLPFKATEVIIKGTTYLVSSFFNNDAKVNVVEKVRRLIKQEADKISER
jgi:hypothetical protein